MEISTERSQLTDFVFDGVNHLDLLYGSTAEKIIQPLIIRAVRQAWAGWKYSKQENRSEKDKNGKEAA